MVERWIHPATIIETNFISQPRIETIGYNHSEVISRYPRHAEALIKSGRLNLLPLLDKKVESKVMTTLEASLTAALSKAKILSQPGPNGRPILTLPNGRIIDDIFTLRKTLEEEMKERGIWGFTSDIRIYPPEDLLGLCGLIDGVMEITDMGKIVSLLKNRMPDLTISIFRGRGKEIAKMKPDRFRRGEILPKYLRIPTMFRDSISPRSDFDFLLVSPPEPIKQKKIERVLNQYILRRSGIASIRHSKRRPKFSYISMRIRDRGPIADDEDMTTKKRGFSLGEIFFPGSEGKYDASNCLVPFLMENSSIDIPIILVPHYHEEEKKWMLWGIAVDFFSGFKSLGKSKSRHQKWLGEPFSFAQIPYPDLAFTKNDLQQTLFNFGHYLRTLPYSSHQPMIRSRDNWLTDEELIDASNPIFRIASTARITQDYITRNVVHYLGHLMKTSKEPLGTESARLSAGISFIEDVLQACDGDAVATLLRLLPEGVTYTTDKKGQLIEPFDYHIFGLGIADVNGLLHNLGTKLLDNNISQRLKERILREAKYSKDYGYNYKKQGRKLLMDFLFAIADESPKQVLELLQPIWCHDLEWINIRKKYLDRLISIDERFNQLTEKRVPHSTSVLKILIEAQQPMQAQDVAKLLGMQQSQVFAVLKSMDDKAEVFRLGGYRGKGSSSGRRVWFCAPEFIDQFEGNLNFMSPNDRVAHAISTESFGTLNSLAKKTHLSERVTTGVVTKLVNDGLVEFKQGKWQLKEPEDEQ